MTVQAHTVWPKRAIASTTESSLPSPIIVAALSSFAFDFSASSTCGVSFCTENFMPRYVYGYGVAAGGGFISPMVMPMYSHRASSSNQAARRACTSLAHKRRLSMHESYATICAAPAVRTASANSVWLSACAANGGRTAPVGMPDSSYTFPLNLNTQNLLICSSNCW